MQKNMIEEYLFQANILKNKIGIFKLENFILILILFKTYYYQDILLLKRKIYLNEKRKLQNYFLLIQHY